jgi:hypothetical protein
MKDLAALRARFEQDAPAVRLGSLASNLNRLAWHADKGSYAVAAPIIRESKYFIEWTAAEWPLDVQFQLADIQLAMACWERRWRQGDGVSALALQAREWSQVLLRSSGLL